jgi:hypothetical protein
MTLEAFVLPRHQGLYPSVEETDVKRLQPGADSLLMSVCLANHQLCTSQGVQRDGKSLDVGQELYKDES